MPNDYIRFKTCLIACSLSKVNAKTIVETDIRAIPTSCGFGHWVCPRRPFCSQYTLIKETENTGEI